MRRGLNIYRGLVVRSSVSNGDLYVRIPELLGPTEAIQIAKDYIYSSGGLWDVPPERSQVLVGLEGERIRNAFIIKVLGAGAVSSGESPSGESPIDDIVQALEELTSDVENLETTISIKAPVGAINDYIGEVAPTGWLLMHGQTITDGQTLYPDLWSVIPATMKSGTNIVLPDTRGKILVDRNSADSDFDNIGKTGGVKNVTLTTAELPSHSHGVGSLTAATSGSLSMSGSVSGSTFSDGDHNHGYSRREFSGTFNYQSGANFQSFVLQSATTANAGSHSHSLTGTASVSGADHGHSISGTTGAIGGGSAHTNLQPYIVTSKIICAV